MASFLVSRALARARDTSLAAFADSCICCALSVLLLEQPEQAGQDARDVRREAGGREVETEDGAHRGVQYPQSRIPAQDIYARAHQQRRRERYGQVPSPPFTARYRNLVRVFIRCRSCGASCGVATGPGTGTSRMY